MIQNEPQRTVYRIFCTLCLVAVSSACAGTPEKALLAPVGPERVGTYSAANVNEIFLELPVGEAQITGSDSAQLHVEMIIECETDKTACTKLGNKVTLNERKTGDALFVAPSVRAKYAYRKSQVAYKIKAPHGVPLKIKFGFGELHVDDVYSELDITMSAGEVSINSKYAKVRNILLDANVGDATLIAAGDSQEGERRLLVGAEVDWREGKGEHDISVDLGAGDITVKLTR